MARVFTESAMYESMQGKAEMVLLHAGGMSQREATAEYHRRHPNQITPSQQLISILMKRFQETDSVAHRPRCGRSRSAASGDMSVDVLANVTVSPERSTRKVGEEAGVSHISVSRTLSRERYHTYKLHFVQELHGDDTDRRTEFCELFRQIRLQHPNLEYDIMLSDEGTLHLNGTVNRHNAVYWSSDNAHIAVEAHHQTDPQVNVWCGIHGSLLLGPIFLPDTLTSDQIPTASGNHTAAVS